MNVKNYGAGGKLQEWIDEIYADQYANHWNGDGFNWQSYQTNKSAINLSVVPYCQVLHSIHSWGF